MAPPLNNKERDKLSLLSLFNPAILLCQVTGAANPSLCGRCVRPHQSHPRATSCRPSSDVSTHKTNSPALSPWACCLVTRARRHPCNVYEVPPLCLFALCSLDTQWHRSLCCSIIGYPVYCVYWPSETIDAIGWGKLIVKNFRILNLSIIFIDLTREKCL